MPSYNELDLLEQLKKDSPKLRHKAAVRLLRNLQLKMSEKPLEWTDVAFIIARLVRGLGCGKLNATRGYYATLVGFLTTVPTPPLTFDLYNSVVEKELEIKEWDKEDSVVYLGRLLAFSSLIQSEFLLHESKQNQKLLLHKVLSLSGAKGYFKHATYFIINQLLLKGSRETYAIVIKKTLEEDLIKSKDSLSIDQLECLMIITERFRSTRLVKKILGVPMLIHRNTVRVVADAISNITSNEMVEHKFYKVFCTKVLEQIELLPHFWNYLDSKIVTCGSLKEVVVLHILRTFLVTIREQNLQEHVPVLMTRNAIQALLQIKLSFSSLKRLIFKDLVASLQGADCRTQLSVLQRLLFDPGDMGFDKITGSRVILEIINAMDLEGVKLLGVILFDVISGRHVRIDPSDGFTVIPWTNMEKSSALEYYSRLLRHSTCYTEIEWRKQQLTNLLQLGFFLNEEFPLSVEFSGLIRSKFFFALGHRFPRLPDYIDVTNHLMDELGTRLTKCPESLKVKLTQQVESAWLKAADIKKKLAQLEQENLWWKPIFELFAAHMALMLFKEPGTAQDTIEEISKIVEKIRSETISDEIEPDWSEVTTDVFLNLLSRNLSTHRHLIGSVFRTFCSRMTPSALTQMTDVLDPEYMLSQDNDDDVDIDGDGNASASSEGEASDEESGADDDSEGSTTEEDENSGSDEEATNVGNTERLRLVLGKTMSNQFSDNDSVDMDDMDVEEGKRLDAALSEAFRAHYKKPNQKWALTQDTLTHFRIRIVDLLMSLLDTDPPCFKNILQVISTLIPLLEHALKQSNQNELVVTIRKWCKKLSTIKKFRTTEDITESELLGVLTAILEKRERPQLVFNQMSLPLMCVSRFLLKMHIHLAASSDTYSNSGALEEYLFKNMRGWFFLRDSVVAQELIRMAIPLGWEGLMTLIPELIKDSLSGNAKQFKSKQGLEMIHYFFNYQMRCAGKKTKGQKFLRKCGRLFIQCATQICSNLNNDSRKPQVKFENMIWKILLVLAKQKGLENEWEPLIEALNDTIIHMPRHKAKNRKELKKLCVALNIDSNRISILSKSRSEPTVDEINTSMDHLSIGQSCGPDVHSAPDSVDTEEDGSQANDATAPHGKSPKKDRKRKRNVNKLKKESKKRRLEAMSVSDDTTFGGIPDVDFNALSDQ